MNSIGRRLFRAAALALCLAGLAGWGGPVCIEGVPCGPVPRYDENRPGAVETLRRFSSREAPMAVAGGLAYSRIGVGGMATCGIVTDRSAYRWGWNEAGTLGQPIIAH